MMMMIIIIVMMSLFGDCDSSIRTELPPPDPSARSLPMRAPSEQVEHKEEEEEEGGREETAAVYDGRDAQFRRGNNGSENVKTAARELPGKPGLSNWLVGQLIDCLLA